MERPSLPVTQPWFLAPEHYDLMVYPAEWTIESELNEHNLRVSSPIFYSRNWGRSKVVSLYTLFYRDTIEMGEDVLSTYIELMKNSHQLKFFPSDGMTLMQGGKLKELAKEHRRQLPGYWATPLIPASVEPFVVYKINLGIPKPLDLALLDLKGQEEMHYN